MFHIVFVTRCTKVESPIRIRKNLFKNPEKPIRIRRLPPSSSDDNKDGAFANLMIQNCSITAVFFFLDFFLTKDAQKWVTSVPLMVAAVAIIPTYRLAKRIRPRQARSEGLLDGLGGSFK